MRRGWIIAVLVAGCAAPDASVAPGGYLPDDLDTTPDDASDPADSPDTVDTEAVCAATLVSLDPEAGARFVDVDVPLVATFSAALPDDASAWSLAVDGVAGTVEVAADGRSATFTPDAPLAYDAHYDVTVSVCDALTSAAFDTIGPPLSVEALMTHTWSGDLGALEWLAPLSSSLWLAQLDLPDAVFSVILDEDDGAPHLAARFAARIDGNLVPIPCAPVIDLGELDLSASPRFATRPTDVSFPWDGQDVALGAVRLEGTFTDDGDAVEAIRFDATLDMRLVEDLLGLDGLCYAAAQVGDLCTACDDGDPSCLRALATYDDARDVGVIDLFDDILARLGLCDVP